jgi:hypothetical protein
MAIEQRVLSREDLIERLQGVAAKLGRQTVARADFLRETSLSERQVMKHYEAFEQGKLSAERCDERLSRLQARLEDLRAQEAELAPPSSHEPGHAPTPADLTALADQLEHVLAEGEPQNAKALLRLMIQELRVDGRAQIQPTYRLVTPAVCATSEKVERTGIEPVTSGLQSSTRSCGMSRRGRGSRREQAFRLSASGDYRASPVSSGDVVRDLHGMRSLRLLETPRLRR